MIRVQRLHEPIRDKINEIARMQTNVAALGEKPGTAGRSPLFRC